MLHVYKDNESNIEVNSAFCSDYILNKYIKRKEGNNAYLQSRTTKNGTKISDVAMKKERARKAMHYAIKSGIAQIAKEDDLQCIFCTITLPPEFHKNPVSGMKEVRRGYEKFRKKLQYNNIKRIGWKSTDIHKSGIPHIHEIVFISKKDIEKYREIFFSVFCYINENIMDKSFIICCNDDSSRLFSYSYKNSHGIVIDRNNPINDSDCESKVRVKAQISYIGARSFSFIGVRGCQAVWQEIYSSDFDSIKDNAKFLMIHKHIHEKEYADALRLLGIRSKHGPIKTLTVQYENSNGKKVYKPIAYMDYDGKSMLVIRSINNITRESMLSFLVNEKLESAKVHLGILVKSRE